MLRKLLPICQLVALTMGQFNPAFMSKRWTLNGNGLVRRDAGADAAEETEYIEVKLLF